MTPAGSGKYGRLFTEEDVRRLIGEAVANVRTDTEDTWAELARFPAGQPIEGMDLPFTVLALVERIERDRELTFPADEPLFLLRGQDKAALAGLRGYVEALGQGFIDVALQGDATALRDHINVVQAARVTFAEWQAANPDRVASARS